MSETEKEESGVVGGGAKSGKCFLSALNSVVLTKVPEDLIKFTPPFEPVFDLISLKKEDSSLCNSKGQLFLGSLASTRDGSLLHIHDIQTIVSVTDAEVEHFHGITYAQYPIEDTEEADILSLLDTACQTIENGLAKGSVLVHCNFGVSRSASVVIAFKARREKISLEETIRQVRFDRRCISPNDGFLKQLHTFLEC